MNLNKKEQQIYDSLINCTLNLRRCLTTSGMLKRFGHKFSSRITELNQKLWQAGKKEVRSERMPNSNQWIYWIEEDK